MKTETKSREQVMLEAKEAQDIAREIRALRDRAMRLGITCAEFLMAENRMHYFRHECAAALGKLELDRSGH